MYNVLQWINIAYTFSYIAFVQMDIKVLYNDMNPMDHIISYHIISYQPHFGKHDKGIERSKERQSNLSYFDSYSP